MQLKKMRNFAEFFYLILKIKFNSIDILFKFQIIFIIFVKKKKFKAKIKEFSQI